MACISEYDRPRSILVGHGKCVPALCQCPIRALDISAAPDNGHLHWQVVMKGAVTLDLRYYDAQPSQRIIVVVCYLQLRVPAAEIPLIEEWVPVLARCFFHSLPPVMCLGRLQRILCEINLHRPAEC